jgi:hypothetical protein
VNSSHVQLFVSPCPGMQRGFLGSWPAADSTSESQSNKEVLIDHNHYISHQEHIRKKNGVTLLLLIQQANHYLYGIHEQRA